MQGNPWRNYRTVVEETEASEEIAKLKQQHPRFEEQWDGFVWLVARKPVEISLGKIIDGVTYRLSHRAGDARSNLPDLAVLYTFDDTSVTILYVSVWEPSEIEEE